MPYRPFLARIRWLFSVEPAARFESIEQAFKSGRLEQPVTPMTDQELARAIREFQATPVSE